MTETLPAKGGRTARVELADLRRVGINPDFWYPVAVSASVRKKKTFAASFAGQRIVLYRGAGGKKSRGAGLLAAGAGRTSHVVTIRTGYPYQTLQLAAEGTGSPAFSLWAAYVPEDAVQRTSHAYGLLMIGRPPVPAALHLAWPFIRNFTERVFAEDRMAVEAEQRAWDEQGQDRNHEVFPLILDLRDVLRSNGVPIRPRLVADGRPTCITSSA